MSVETIELETRGPVNSAVKTSEGDLPPNPGENLENMPFWSILGDA